MSIDGTFGTSLTINDRQLAGLAGIFTIPVARNPSIQVSNGTGAKQGTQLYGNVRVLSGTTDNVNLTTLTDNHGNAVDFLTIKGISVENNSATHTLVVGDGTTPWITLLNATGTITLPPGAFFSAGTPDAVGWVVTASTAMDLLFTGTSGESYNLVLWG